jgi:hypothetical protein
MKIYIYIIIAIVIYLYIIKNDIYIIDRTHHMYFWGIIGGILLICYLMRFHKYHLYKFFYNMKKVDDKPYFYK